MRVENLLDGDIGTIWAACGGVCKSWKKYGGRNHRVYRKAIWIWNDGAGRTLCWQEEIESKSVKKTAYSI